MCIAAEQINQGLHRNMHAYLQYAWYMQNAEPALQMHPWCNALANAYDRQLCLQSCADMLIVVMDRMTTDMHSLGNSI